MHVDTTKPATTWPAATGDVVGRAVVLAAATAGGAGLLAVAQSGISSLRDLALRVGLPAAAVVVLVLVVAAVLRIRPLASGIVVGVWTGLVSTIALEAVRTVGFRLFESMPGDLPQLMGVLMTDRIMQGPSTFSTVLGYADHYWNGALFGVTYVLLLGSAPRGRSRWWAALVGAVYGALLATGFLASPAVLALGAGLFGTFIGPKFAVTVYLAHLAFGASLGALVHRFGRTATPVWEPLLVLARAVTNRS